MYRIFAGVAETGNDEATTRTVELSAKIAELSGAVAQVILDGATWELEKGNRGHYCGVSGAMGVYIGGRFVTSVN